MFLRNALYMVLFTSALVFAGGRTAPEGQNGEPMNGGNGTNGGDTTEIEGTVSSVDVNEQMLVIEHAFGEDTVYWDDQTQVSQDELDRILTEGAQVRVEYVEEEDRKVATLIELTSANGENGADGEEQKDQKDQNGDYMEDEDNSSE